MGENMKSLIKISIILILTSFCLFAQEMELDKMPSPDGGISAIAKNIKYPEKAKVEGIEGKVFVKATIDETGKVIETEIVRSVSKECDLAAVYAVENTKWIPGEKDGKQVSAQVTIPIEFKLGDKDKETME